MGPPGTAPLAPPPMYRQEEPRSESFVAQAVSESISPENGAVGGVERPVPPQDDVPGAVVYLSDRGPRVVVVVLDVVVVVGAVLLVVVVAAPLLVVVVAAPLLVVVVAAPVVVVVAHSVAPSQVPPTPLVLQVHVIALHAALTVLVQAANAPPLSPDSAALGLQFLLPHVGGAAKEDAALSHKRAATTVIVRVTLPMTSSVLPGDKHFARGQSPRGPR